MEKFHLIALNTSDLIAFTTFDINPIFTFVSPSHKKILGYNPEDLLGKSGFDFIHKDDKQRMLRFLFSYVDAKINGVLTKVMVENAPKLDFRFCDKSGNWHLLHSSVDLVNDELLFISKDVSEQHRVQQAFVTSEGKYRNLYNNLRDGSAAVDMQGRIIECNPSFTNMLGYSFNGLSRITFEDITPVKWHDYEKRILEEQVQRRGYSDLYEKEYIRKDGTVFPVELQTYAIRDEKNQLTGYWAFVRDITSRKQIEKALYESDERFRLAISSITDILYEWNIQTDMIQWFGDIDTLLGYEIGKSPRSLHEFLKHIHPDDVNTIQTVMTNGLKNHQKWQVEYRIINKNGTQIHLCGTGIAEYDGTGNPVRVIGAVNDITKRKEAEVSLQESRQMLRLIMDTIPARVFWKDLDSKYLGCNQSFAKDAGMCSVDEVIGKNDFDMGWSEQAEMYRSDDQLVIRSGQPKLNYVELQNTPDGRKIWLRTSKIPLLNSQNTVIGILGTYEDITEQKKAEDALRRSEEQYRLVTEHASDVIWTMDLNLRFTYFSPSNEKLTGYRLEEALNLSLDKLLTPESVERSLQTFAEEMELEPANKNDFSRSVILELQERRADGTIFPIEARMSFLRDKDNNPIGIIGITRDITERKKAEEALKKSERKFVKAFKLSPVAIAINRISDGRFLDVNEAFAKICGYDPVEVISYTPVELNLWVNTENIKHILDELKTSGSVYNMECVFRTKAGTHIVTRYSAEIIDFSGEQCYLSVLFDVTKQKEMEESLKESEEKYRSIVENTQDVIMLTNPTGRVDFISPACFDVLGYRADEILGEIPEIFHHEDVEKVHSTLSKALEGVPGTNLEYRVITKDGSVRWVSHSWAPVLNQDKKLKYVVSVVRNITNSKLAEQNLKMKIEELEKFKRVTINREIKMVELKKEINALYKQFHQT